MEMILIIFFILQTLFHFWYMTSDNPVGNYAFIIDQHVKAKKLPLYWVHVRTLKSTMHIKVSGIACWLPLFGDAVLSLANHQDISAAQYSAIISCHSHPLTPLQFLLSIFPGYDTGWQCPGSGSSTSFITAWGRRGAPPHSGTWLQAKGSASHLPQPQLPAHGLQWPPGYQAWDFWAAIQK